MARDRVLPTSLITLHILAVTVVLCSTFTAVYAVLGESCDTPCASSSEKCDDQNNVCICAPDYYNKSGTCNPKISNGTTCANEGPSDQCVGDLQCLSNSSGGFTCRCQDGHYFNPDDGSCLQKISNGTTCANGGPSNQCVGDLQCSGNPSSGFTCRCQDGFYFNPDDDSCQLKISTGTTCADGGPSNQCVGDLQCLSNSSGSFTCRCQDGHYFNPDDDSCQQKISNGNGCTSGGPSDQCVGDLQCLRNPSSGFTCRCEDDHYFILANGSCLPKVAHEVECDASISDVCKNQGTICTNDKTGAKRCLCDSTSYFNSGSCSLLSLLKVTITPAPQRTTNNVTLTWTANAQPTNVGYRIQTSGGPSSIDDVTGISGTTVPGLAAGEKYSFTIIPFIPENDYYQEKTGDSTTVSEVWTKIAHAKNCTPATQPTDICFESNTNCTTTTESGGPRCLCSEYYYRRADGSVCDPLSQLKVRITPPPQRTTNNVTLTWTANAQPTNVGYRIQTSGGPSSIGDMTGNSGTTVPGLVPGTEYNFTVIPVVSSALYYPPIDGDPTTISKVWTIPAKPGNVTGFQLVQEEPVIFDITFQPSDGQVARYEMTIEGVNNSGQTAKIRFQNLKQGQVYSFSITAFNGKSDPSAAFNSSLKTPADVSGPVSELQATDISNNGTTATWKKPVRPGGEISGYTLRVTKGLACVFGYSLTCSDCTSSNAPGSTTGCLASDTGMETKNDLNDDTKVFTVVVPGLEPYRNYTLAVTADNEEGIGETNSTVFTTNASPASDVTDVTAKSDRNNGQVNLTVTWKPGYFTGPTTYDVTLEEETKLDSENFSVVSTESVTGYNSTTWFNSSVLAYWKYRVFVQAKTDAGRSGVVGSEIKLTASNTPGLPQAVTVMQNETVAQELTLTVTCPEEKSRNGIITGYVIRKKLADATEGVGAGNEYTVNVSSSQTCKDPYTVKAKDVGGIIVGNNYTFEVKVKNTNFTGSFSDEEFLIVEPKAPRFQEILQVYGVKSLVKLQEGAAARKTEIDVSVCAKCLLDERQGTVTNVSLVVCKVGKDDSCIDTARMKRELVVFRDYTTWSSARSQSFNVPYRATPDNWMSSLTSPNTSYPYRIGTDANCRTDANTVYCNGPLPADTRFKVAVIQCNSVGCVIGTFEGPFRTGAEDDETPVGAIVGAVVGVLVVAAIVAGVAFFLWRRRKGKPTRTSNPIWDIDNQSKQNVPPPVSRPIRIRDFKDEVTKMHKDCNLMFQDQFEDIKKLSAELNATTNEAQREGNRVKNRYVDILPYDHSRVKLSTTPEDDETMDFINANYIAGYSSVREYIATQGPMHCTIPDFWRMAWEQNCRVIVMLSDLQENGKRKVGLYWPENLNDPINYGTVVVEMTNFSQLNKYIIRNFVVKKGNETRKMTHFFLPGWWDFSANLTFDDVLEFAKLVRQEATPHTDGPIIVHCSAGVGRTGTLIALDYFMQFIDKHSLDDTIDVYKFVLEMRKNRPRMVQAETQYIFIFDALVEVIQNKIKAEEERLYDNCSQGNNIYANVGNKQEENIYANTENNAYVYNNEAFEPEYQNMEMKSQDKTEKPTTEL